MLYEYLISNYETSEPIFLSDISGYSPDYIRQEMKRLTDEGKINRLYNGVYYIPYKTILGTNGNISIDKFIEKKYTNIDGNVSGYYTGLYLANLLGITSQNPSCLEVCSNAATTKQRKINVLGFNILIYKPTMEITSNNIKELQFLDLMLNIDKYSEVDINEQRKKIQDYINSNNLNFELIKEYLPLYPDRIYKNLYNGGVMNELV